MKRVIINPIFKDKITFLQTAEETNGEASVLEVCIMPRGHFNTIHYHKTYSEIYTAIDGDLGIKLGKEGTIILKEGESYTIPPMQNHGYFNPTNRVVKFKVEVKPGHPGFENSLRILYGLAEDGLTRKNSIPKKLKHVAMISDMSDMNVPGIYTLLTPILKRMAKKARRSGEEQALIEKYCH